MHIPCITIRICCYLQPLLTNHKNLPIKTLLNSVGHEYSKNMPELLVDIAFENDIKFSLRLDQV